MKVLVVVGHQKPGSFCHAIAATAVDELRGAGHAVIEHDLYAERFDPVLPAEEVPRDAPLPPSIQTHLDELTSSDGYIIVHPNWWGQTPAVLKGWIDRVFRQGATYTFGPQGVVGLLRDKRALVFTTSNTPRQVELDLYGDPLENWWKTCVFGFCGVTDFTRRNFESIVMSSADERRGWLEETRRLVRAKFPPAG